MLIIPAAELERIREQAQRDYPSQCCGLLLGVRQEGKKLALRAEPCVNAAEDRGNSYAIAAAELTQRLRAAHEQQWQLLGFYHSHPDRPANLSDRDISCAEWTSCSYLVLSVEDGRMTVFRSFVADQQADMLEEPVQIGTEV